MFSYKNFINENYQFIVYFKHKVGLCGKGIKIKNYDKKVISFMLIRYSEYKL